MSKAAHYALVINSMSRQGKDSLPAVKAALSKRSEQIDLHVINKSAEFTSTINKVADDNYTTIILAGGDGTIISGIELLRKAKFDGTFGMLPLGTANYLAKNIGIPFDIEQALDIAINGTAKKVPLGVSNGRYFALLHTCGITQELSATIDDDFKKRLGQFAYVLGAIKISRQHESFTYTVSSDELKNDITGRTHQIVVQNSDLNLQLPLLPEQEIYSPKLVITIFDTDHSLWKLYAALVTSLVTLGKIQPYFKTTKVSSARITTQPILQGSYDGEVANESPFDISVVRDVALMQPND